MGSSFRGPLWLHLLPKQRESAIQLHIRVEKTEERCKGRWPTALQCHLVLQDNALLVVDDFDAAFEKGLTQMSLTHSWASVDFDAFTSSKNVCNSLGEKGFPPNKWPALTPKSYEIGFNSL